MKIAYNSNGVLDTLKPNKQSNLNSQIKSEKFIEDYDERSARIENIKNQIQNGTYKLDMKATAQAIKNELFNIDESHDI